jgi:hypothetical protein
MRIAPAIVLFVALLTACGSSAGTAGSPGQQVTAAATSAPAATASAATATGDPLVTWCQLTIGESQTAVMAAMGPVHGSKAAAYAVPGIQSAEWDVGNDILLASFQNSATVNLQAYAGQVGPNGATDIGCAAFRSSGG